MALDALFRRIAGYLVISLILCFTAYAQPAPRRCNFNAANLSFQGSALEQARCLLRKVKIRAALEEQNLPPLLERIIDQPVPVSKASLREYLRRRGIGEMEIGGSLDRPLSRGRSNDRNAPHARYFVIHDTSTPNLCDQSSFPGDINDDEWTWRGVKWNNPLLSLYADSGEAHLYIMRDGKSVAPRGRTFETPWRATKLESGDVRTRGMFLHIENVQPRHCSPESISAGRCVRMVRNRSNGRLERQCNDNIAPEPGFSEAQLEKLALAYIAASVRSADAARGTPAKWLIPGFHAALDAGLSDGHDDPQNFDLQKWADKICSILRDLRVECPA
jgi:hypothetical protein